MLGNNSGLKQWQEVAAFSKCLTATELAKLQGGDLSEKACIHLAVKGAALIGMHTLSETSKGRVAAVVALAAGNVDTADARMQY